MLLPPFPQLYQYMLLMYYYSICTKSGIGKYISCILYLQGSKKTTSYTWNFGDDDKNRIVCKGFDQAKNQTHTYNKRGLYNVSIVAKNAVGTSYVSMIVMVEGTVASPSYFSIIILKLHVHQLTGNSDNNINIASSPQLGLLLTYLHNRKGKDTHILFYNVSTFSKLRIKNKFKKKKKIFLRTHPFLKKVLNDYL